ncbi:hypothetical protein ACGC1H_006076 [Rhizoctonia solani]
MADFTVNKLVRVTAPLEDKSIVLVELNRGPVNAFNQPFWEELGSTFDKISRDGSVRAVVLSSSNPKVFASGLDLSDTGALVNKNGLDPARQAFKLRHHVLHFQSCISAIERCAQPVIAAVNGIAYGLAIDILCACDIRYSSSSARFSIKEVDVGLAADIGTLSRLPKITGNESLLRELAFTAREFGPREAVQLGMVSRVVEGGRDDVLGAALELAKVIAAKSPWLWLEQRDFYCTLGIIRLSKVWNTRRHGICPCYNPWTQPRRSKHLLQSRLLGSSLCQSCKFQSGSLYSI